MKAISPDVLKTRYLAMIINQEFDNFHADRVCISQILKRYQIVT